MSPPVYRVRMKTFSVVREGALPVGEPITTAVAATGYLLPFFLAADAGREHFAVLYLDSRHRPIAAKILFSGSTGETPVFPKEVAKTALLLNASAVVVAHNHPSGELSPSPEDRAVQRRLEQALKLLDITLLDFLILCPETGRHNSLNENS